MTKKTLKKTVEEFILGRDADFRFQDIADALSAEAGGFSEKTLLDILETNGLVFSRDFNAFKPRHLFFRNARFIISPTEEEIRGRLLIPGHRFIPFCSCLTHPWKCTLLASSAEGEARVPQKTVRKSISSLLVYYTLFGQENLPMLLIQDQPENEDALNPSREEFESACFDVTAFDFTTLFRQWNFSYGDGILLEVRDWIHGIFTVEHLPKKRRRELMESSGEWIAKLEKGFLKTFDDLGLEFPLEEQVAYAYYYAGPQILKTPPLHLGGFIDSSPRVNIVPIGMETRLWYETRIDAALLGANPEAPTGATGSLDAIFEDLNVSLTEAELEAYMRDELFRRKENPDAVLERIFESRAISFFSDGQMNDFSRYFKKLWNRVKKNYNYFADQFAGKARGRILELLDRHYAWLRSLESYEAAEKDLPIQEVASLSQSVEFLVENLALLNKKSPGHEKEIRESIELLPQMEELLDDLHEEISIRLEELPQEPEEKRPALYLVKPDTPGEKKDDGEKTGSVYVLRVNLLYIAPQIWRSFQVPGSFSLEELHQVIQDVMGWESYHVHSFLVDGKHYGPRMEESFGFGFEQEDEANYTLDNLALKEKQKIQYTYDFGDSWLHQIAVTKVLPAAACSGEELSHPRCLGGRRACPPEDCGGVSGYDEIIEALKAPNRKKNRELLDWLGDYDPEAFDIDAVNKILRKNI
ncbi:MAG: plasmid pRiA4b ORF-3 family protein [Spirochaetales bacterium]|jgi:hypothetical protein|nr:plasmid pRiA4b ORF-3 family protein [Spirochaetales bacterium]